LIQLLSLEKFHLPLQGIQPGCQQTILFFLGDIVLTWLNILLAKGE
jgi:hypothetical protein